MNETASKYQAELTLPASDELPRIMELQLTTSTLYASVFCKSFFISSTYGLLTQCYLDISVPSYEFISIGRACFRICEAEVTQIRAVLEPLGLQVREAS